MKTKGLFRPWLCAALLFALLAVLMVAFSGDYAFLFFPEGSPEETADRFFACLENGDQASASALCFPALGAESCPGEEDAAALYDAVCASRHWQREGEVLCRGNRAQVSGTLRVLDPAALCEGLNGDVNAVLATLVSEARLSSEIYKEDGSYREDVVMKAWSTAFSARLERAEDYMTSFPLTLQLIYRNGSWTVQPDEELMKALSGGVA